MPATKEKVIREEMVKPSTTFAYDVATRNLVFLMVTWSVSDDSAAAPTALIFCPTNSKRANPSQGNFPGIPTGPLPGYNAYAALGPDMQVSMPLPEMVTVGVTTPALCTCSVRISGFYHEENGEFNRERR